MNPLVVIEVPGLSGRQVRTHAPHLEAIGKDGFLGSMESILPATTMPAHASLMTGTTPSDHGVVANGWFVRAQNEVRMWQQSERLVAGERVWEAGKKRDSDFKCLKYFWWPGMASTADVYGNVRPIYYADGRKGPDVYMNSPGLAEEIQSRFGTFPLFKFWGPAADITSSQWIAETSKFLFDRERPTLSLIYLPHLDYRQQTHGPDDPSIVSEIKAIASILLDLVEHFRSKGAQVLLLSSYQMNAVKTPVDINRCLRKHGWLKVIQNAAGELIDYGTSQAFAVVDHQLAHVYVTDESVRSEVSKTLTSLSGVAEALEGDQLEEAGLSHSNSGELVLKAERNAWFTYYYWLDDSAAPDFARSVAIHDKPGYDPCEMFVDPSIPFPKLKVGGLLAKKLLGFRYTMNVIPLDASLVKGSHGLPPESDEDAPVVICTKSLNRDHEKIRMVDIKDTILSLIFS